MAEYIEREALLKKLHEAGGCGAEPDTWADGYDKGIDVAYGLVQRTPAANVAPVRHGCWEGAADGYADGELVYDMWNCSECGFDADGAEEKPWWNYCPNCGARMD